MWCQYFVSLSSIDLGIQLNKYRHSHSIVPIFSRSSWTKLPDMTMNRGQTACVRLPDGSILAIGGADDLNALCSVERLEYPLMEGSQWHFLNLMNYRRHHPRAAAFRDKVFVVGGWNTPDRISFSQDSSSYVQPMEMFTPSSQESTPGQWTVITPGPTFHLIIDALPCVDGIVAFGKRQCIYMVNNGFPTNVGHLRVFKESCMLNIHANNLKLIYPLG